MLRKLLLALVLVITGCGGGDGVSSLTPNQPLDIDPATAQTWARWAAEAQQIASFTRQMYTTGRLSSSTATDQQQRAQRLAQEIRETDPSNQLVLKLADDLDDLIGALEFGLQYAQNAGFTVINIVIADLEDAYAHLAEDAAALSESLPQAPGSQ